MGRRQTHRFLDSKKQRKLIYVQLQSLIYYQPLLKKLTEDYRVKQLFNTDLLHVQQYLFTKLRIEPTSKVKVEYNGLKLLEMTKVDDIMVCMGDYDNGKVIRYLSARADKIGFDLQLERICQQ